MEFFNKCVKGVRYLKHYGFKEFVIRLQEKMEAEEVPYEPWYAEHAATEGELIAQKKETEAWGKSPKVSIVVPLYNTPEKFLVEMIESVKNQSYSNWELVLADASPKENGSSPLKKIVEGASSGDERIVYSELEENLGIAGNTNKGFELATGDWVALLDHDDLLAPDALYCVVKKILEGPVDRTGVEAETYQGLLAKGHMAPHENKTRLHDNNFEKNSLPSEDGQAVYDMIYTDEDKVDMEGKTHFQPHLKPDFNIDLLRSNNYITHFLCIRRSLLEQVGYERADYDGAQDYDLILRCAEAARAIGHVPRILYHWRSHKESTSANPFSKQYAVDAGKRAIEAHLARLGVEGTVAEKKDMGFYNVTYELKEEPLVSIIIPNKDQVDTLTQCLTSLENSTYKNFEVIVVENNSNEDTMNFYRSITDSEDFAEGITPHMETEGAASDRVKNNNKAITRILSGSLKTGQKLTIACWEDGFNYSALNNFGRKFATGEYLVLLNNDIELITDKGLEILLATCQRSEVGIAGAKLYYPDDTIQHAGIVVGIGGNARGIAQNMLMGLPGSRSGYLHKASLIMDMSAVTAAFLMVKASVFDQVKGLDERLSVAFNDVDFCLKVRHAGYLVVYQPNCEAYHYESKSRGAEDTKEKVDRFQTEIELMRNKWIDVLKLTDPYYNPNFSTTYPTYALKGQRVSKKK